MAIEDVILGREGFSEINRLTKYISSLVIKNEAEGAEYETDLAEENYLKYEASYIDSKNIFLYSYTREEAENYFNKDIIENCNIMDARVINKMILQGRNDANNFLEYLQNKALNEYVEYNQYYRKFLGKPSDTADRIYVQNLDSNNPNDVVLIHEVNEKNYPETFDYYFIKRNIDDLIETYPDLDYLKFIENPISPFRYRKSPDFTIFYSNDTILESDEITRFKKAYNKARIYISQQLYCIGQAKRYPLYGNLTLVLILYYTFCLYFNLKLEEYSLRNYTKYDILDILESNGLTNLTKISDLEILRKIVMNLDTLNQYKGTEYVLTILFKILDDKSITVKRFNLVKEYKTNNKGYLEFDINGLYSDSVDLVFKETPIAIDLGNLIESKVSERFVTYESKTDSDDKWGGIEAGVDTETKRKIKNSLKREILQTDFDELRTKYISISKSMNMYEKSIETNNIFYLILKYFSDMFSDPYSNPLYNDSISLFGHEITPITLIATFCYYNNVLAGIDEPWRISIDRCFLSNLYIFRTSSSLALDLKNIKNTEIEIGNPIMTKKISDYITLDDDLTSLLIKYNITSSSTLIDIISEYEKNKEVITILKDKIGETNDTGLYHLYKKIEEINSTTYDFRHIFQGYTDFREVIQSDNPIFFNYIEQYANSVINENKDPLEYIFEKSEVITERLEDWINVYLEGKKYFSFSTSREDNRYLNDLKILMAEYVSVFSELYAIEKVIDLSDHPNNILKTTFIKTSTKLKRGFNEIIRVGLTKKRIKTILNRSLSLIMKEKYRIKFINTFFMYLDPIINLIQIRSTRTLYDKISIFIQRFSKKIRKTENINIKTNFALKSLKLNNKEIYNNEKLNS